VTPTRADASPVPARPLAPEPAAQRPADSPKDAAKAGSTSARPTAARPADALAQPQRATGGDRLGVEGAAARVFRSLLGARGGEAEQSEPIEADADGATEAPAAWTGAPASAPVDVPAAAPVAAAVAVGIDPAAAARADRMAAAVAEALAAGREPVYSIKFNDPDGLAEGALLIREASGALVVRLEGVLSAARALAPAALESDLRVALDRRRVRLSRVEYGAPTGRSLTKSPRFAEAI
jgi:hypothetical protein